MCGYFVSIKFVAFTQANNCRFSLNLVISESNSEGSVADKHESVWTVIICLFPRRDGLATLMFWFVMRSEKTNWNASLDPSENS